MLTIDQKLQTATEGSRELDLEVLNALGIAHAWFWLDRERETITCNRYGLNAVGNPVCSLERFTTSIDDALALIPDRFNWLLGKGKTREDEPPFGVQILETTGAVVGEGESISAPIAICIAALRARDV